MDAKFPKKLERLFEPSRYKVLWGGRGAGRSWGVARALLILGTRKPIRVLCTRELQNSMRDSVHQLLSDQIDRLGLGQFYRVEKERIYGANGGQFSFEGIRNNTTKIKSYEGVDYCWVEEAVKVSKHSWGILIPTIRKEGSEIWMTFNPEFEDDYTYQRFVLDADESCIVIHTTWRDNPWFPEVLRQEMERDKIRDEDYYLNVWEGQCVQVLDGAVYAKELRKLQREGRICEVPWDKSWPVDTFWDLGRADATAVWFAQRVAMQTRVLDFYSNTGEDITHYLAICQQKGYNYGTMWLPHDARAERLGSKKTIEEIVRQAGYRVQIVPKLSVTDGINAARIAMNECWFDQKKCADGIRGLRAYRFKVVDGQRANAPLHDWASDSADAFRYLAIALTGAKPPEESILDKLRRAMRKPEPEFANEDWRRGPTSLDWMRY